MSTYESDGNEADEYPWRNRELLERLYHEEQMSQREIADALNSDKATIYRWMVRHDIDCRPVGGQRMSKPYKDRDTLETLYHRKRMRLDGTTGRRTSRSCPHLSTDRTMRKNKTGIHRGSYHEL